MTIVLKEKEIEILRILQEHEEAITIDDLREKLDNAKVLIKERTLYTYLTDLKVLGLLSSEIKTVWIYRLSFYSITEKGRKELPVSIAHFDKKRKAKKK